MGPTFLFSTQQPWAPGSDANEKDYLRKCAGRNGWRGSRAQLKVLFHWHRKLLFPIARFRKISRPMVITGKPLPNLKGFTLGSKSILYSGLEAQ